MFTRPATVDIVIESLRYLIARGLKVYAFVILENHLHLVADSEQLDIDMARFKSFTARRIIQYLDKHKVSHILDQLVFYKKAHKKDRAYQFWQEGYHPTLIENHKMLQQRVKYIHINPVKRGYVDRAEHWRYSSARNYLGEEGLIEVCTEW